GASGITSYACDAKVENVVTILGGQVIHINLMNGVVTIPPIEPGVFDARLSPDSSTISYVRGGALCVCTLDGNERVLATEDNDTVSWGSAEFIAAEEMGRFRGYWWSPDSNFIAACRVDVDPIDTWYIADPAHPTSPAVEHRYPAAGTANAIVSLHIVSAVDGSRVDVALGGEWEYLNSVSWSTGGLIAQTQTRDQKRVDIHVVNPANGSSRIEYTDTDANWVELVPGVPAILDNGHIVTCTDRGGMRQVVVNNFAATSTRLQVRSVVSVGDTIVFTANELETPWITDAWTYNIALDTQEPLTRYNGSVSLSGTADAYVSRTSTLATIGAEFEFVSATKRFSIRSLAETPLVKPNVRIMAVGPRQIPVAILLPNDGLTTPLPVLFDPYGGPHAQRVVNASSAFNSSQWFADQGFVVVIADNTGTPGKGSAWERGVANDLAQQVLEDQVEVLRALDDLEPRADTTRVGIRGWSFGGYLAALAVLRRGDVFHAGIAGAPVTDWRLYDTHYTERYLGNPAVNDAPYAATSLMNDAASLERPLLLIHGLADDNVVAAHTLQLSSALLAAGKPHEVLPLSGVTHMTPQEEVAENLLLHQLEFLRRTLG
ncbi:MAG: prolyl oligopeptidase family serine peptidase, partial [Actinobacteria bacterium]|nr:prolyl oligopeptidase family serine peptidase [Actinomycetota bacterium]